LLRYHLPLLRCGVPLLPYFVPLLRCDVPLLPYFIPLLRCFASLLRYFFPKQKFFGGSHRCAGLGAFVKFFTNLALLMLVIISRTIDGLSVISRILSG